MLLLKILLICALIGVFIQDYRDRMVYWFLFPLVALLSGILMYQNMFSELFLTTISINLGFVLILVLIVYLYSALKLKRPINQTFAIGDALLILALAFTFPSITFVVLFVSGLIFSLLLHFVIKQSKTETVPLAGYLSLFFAIAHISHWLGLIKSVYII